MLYLITFLSIVGCALSIYFSVTQYNKKKYELEQAYTYKEAQIIANSEEKEIQLKKRRRWHKGMGGAGW